MNAQTLATPLCVLIVDDSEDTCASIAMLVELWGHDAHVAGDGLAALQIAARDRPDVVLLDLAMPGMDGYEVARRLRQQTRTAPPFVVSMSGHSGVEHRRHALEAGCDLFWIKPADPDELRRLLESRMRARYETESGRPDVLISTVESMRLPGQPAPLSACGTQARGASEG